MIAGLESISGGTLSIDDRVVNGVPPKERDIAMVFQNYALYPHMTVYDNMAFGLKLRKLPKTEIDRRVREAGDILGLEDLLQRKPKALSGGQRQRVAMGRAIVREPKAFLMDEPLSNLDAKLRVQMRTEIARIQHELNVTTIYVTHDQVEAMTMGDRVAVIRKGKLQQVDTPQRLYDHPVNLFVAGFIGSPAMNMVEATLSTSNGAAIVEFGGQTLSVPPEVVASHPGLGELRGRDRRRWCAARRPRGCDRSFPRHRQDRRIADDRRPSGVTRCGRGHPFHGRRAAGDHGRHEGARTRRRSRQARGRAADRCAGLRVPRPAESPNHGDERGSRSNWSSMSHACTSSNRRQAWRSTRTEPERRRG